MAMASLTLDIALRRRFALFDRLGWLDRRGMHLVDPWPIGASLGMSRAETERALASLEAIGWIGRGYRDGEVRVALTVVGLARR